MPNINMPKMNNTWKNTNDANSKNGWDPNKLVIPGYDNPTPKAKEPQMPQDTLKVRQPESQQSKDESNIQWLRRKMGF